MSKIDQVESLFRAAWREPYRPSPVRFSRVLVLTDLDAASAEAFTRQARAFVPPGALADGAGWHTAVGDDFHAIDEMLALIERQRPGLIVSYRNLHSHAWRYPHSLGVHLDVLLQDIDTPVLVMPHPEAGYRAEHALSDCDTVMVVTDHLTRQHRLVDHGAALTESGGVLILTHIEDERTFERYLDAIARIDSIDTDEAREQLQKRLLADPSHYIESCVEQLAGRGIEIEALVTFGRSLRDCKALIESRHLDLLVMNAKDDEQLAMHGLAYPLAVELRQIPLLIL